MGYVPPTFEEFQNPELLLQRLRRQDRLNGWIWGTGLAVLALVVIAALVR